MNIQAVYININAFVTRLKSRVQTKTAP